MGDERRIEKGGKGIGKESEEERLGRQREEVSLLFFTLTHAAARSTPGTRPQETERSKDRTSIVSSGRFRSSWRTRRPSHLILLLLLLPILRSRYRRLRSPSTAASLSTRRCRRDSRSPTASKLSRLPRLVPKVSRSSSRSRSAPEVRETCHARSRPTTTTAHRGGGDGGCLKCRTRPTEPGCRTTIEAATGRASNLRVASSSVAKQTRDAVVVVAAVGVEEGTPAERETMEVVHRTTECGGTKEARTARSRTKVRQEIPREGCRRAVLGSCLLAGRTPGSACLLLLLPQTTMLPGLRLDGIDLVVVVDRAEVEGRRTRPCQARIEKRCHRRSRGVAAAAG